MSAPDRMPEFGGEARKIAVKRFHIRPGIYHEQNNVFVNGEIKGEMVSEE
jgi:hypothetical protein